MPSSSRGRSQAGVVIDESRPPCAQPAPRSRRALLTAAAAAGGALATQALVRPSPVAAASVELGAVNTATTATTIRTTEATASAKALVGLVLDPGIAGPSTAGVQGQSNAAGGNGVFGYAPTGNSKGVWGRSLSGTGVYGEATTATGITFGVRGNSASTGGVGVQGTALAGSGATYGVLGSVASPAGRGVQGSNTGVNGTGVFGVANAGGSATGVWGKSTDGTGVFGEASGSLGIGVTGIGPYRGVYGASSTNYGVWAEGYTGVASRGSSVGLDSVGGAWGLYAQGPTYAGYFNGNVHIEGTLTGGAAGFRIDHPLAPGARFLEHGYVDAPERLSAYRGTVTLDANGTASVRLPRYVSRLSQDFGYQLTALDGPAPGLHVARRVSAAGSFRIAGGASGQQVCWLITGARSDPWAKAHPLRVERRKSRKDQGKYLNPGLFGKRRSAAIGRPPRPASVRRRRGRAKE